MCNRRDVSPTQAPISDVYCKENIRICRRGYLGTTTKEGEEKEYVLIIKTDFQN